MASQNITSENIVRFGPFELDPETGELRKHGTRLKISGQAMQVLIVLTAVPGEMVTREVLKKKLWPGATSGDFEHGLNAAVNRLREVLGDSASDPVYVETIPGKGYRFIGRPADGPELHPIDAVSGPPRRSSKAPRIWMAAAVAVVIGVSLYVLRGPIERTWRLYQRQQLTVSRLTSLPGVVTSPSFSPDGSQIAFAWNPDGKGFDLYVKALGSDVPHRLTSHPSTWFSVAWAPNGQSIATAHMNGDAGSGIYLISPSGGPERKIADRSDRKWYGQELSWSADSKQLAYIDRPDILSETRLELSVLSLDTLQKQRIETGCVSSGTPAFSPRGQYLAWVCNHGMCASAIEVLRLRDQQRSQVYHGGACIEGIGWSNDERRILFSSKADSGSLHEVEIERPNHVETLSVGQDAADISVKPNGDGFAYVKGTYNATIWRIDLAGTSEARRLIASSQMDEAPNFSPDGKKIAFESNRSGSTEVWMCDADGSNAQQLSSFGGVSGSPRWSPDGKLILFDSRAEGPSNLYVVSPEGGIPRKIEIDIRGNSLPSWSHDGKWIYFTNGDDEGRTTIWKVPAGGGHAIQLAGVGSRYSQESADGSLLYFAKGDTLWSVRTGGGGEQLVEGMPKMNFLGDEWVATGEGIYYLGHHGNQTLLELFDPKTKAVRTVVSLPKQTPPWIGAMAISKDGRSLLLPEVDIWSSDVMMMEGWK